MEIDSALLRISFFLLPLVPAVPTGSRSIVPPVYYYVIITFGTILFWDSALVFLPCFRLTSNSTASIQHVTVRSVHLLQYQFQGEQHLSVSLVTGHSHVFPIASIGWICCGLDALLRMAHP
jgi:hypothetical protein